MPAFDAELPNDREFRSAFVAYIEWHTGEAPPGSV